MTRGGVARRLGATAALVVLVLALGACGNAGVGADEQPLLVAAASDLQPAFTVLGEDFEAATGHEVTFSFGSSGQLAQQIVEGSPADLFASASAVFVDQVVEAGVGDPDTRSTYAYGRIAIWSSTPAWGGWDGLDALVADDAVRTLAIANPEHAPYGLAARQALESAGLWQEIQARLVFGENISDTQRLAASGNADAAIVALSLALAADERGEGRWTLVSDDLHDPLRQDLVIAANDPDRSARARAFVEHLSSDEGRAVMRRFGFLLPGEDPPAAWED